MVAAPVLQFGMYSSPVHLSDTQQVYTISINNKPLEGSSLSFTDRDILQVSLSDYEKQAGVNASVYNTMHKFLGFTGLMNRDKYSNELTDAEFTQWYKTKLEKIVGNAVDPLTIVKQNFMWQHQDMQPIGTPVKLAFIVP